MTSITGPRGVFAQLTVLMGLVTWSHARRMGGRTGASLALGFGRKPAQAV